MNLIEKSNLLKSIIKEQLDIDIMEKSRFRHIVDARRIYSYILYKSGHGYTEIGKTLNKDHATIIHYLRHFKIHIEQSEVLKENLNQIKYVYDILVEEENKINKRSRAELITLVENMTKTISELTDENEDLKLEIKKITRKNTRHLDLYRLIETRVNDQNENIIRVKLNHLLNGLQV